MATYFGGIMTGGTNSATAEVTKADLLALIASDGLLFPATYVVTDIGAGLVVDSTSSNTVATDASLQLFAPNYEVGGVELGQLNANDIQTVAAGERIIWADYYWENQTASPIVPTIVDEYDLSGGLTQLAKSEANGYVIINLNCEVDQSLRIGSVHNPVNNSTYITPTQLGTPYTDDLITTRAFNNLLIGNVDLFCVVNWCDAELNVSNIQVDNPLANTVNANTGKAENIYLIGTGSHFNNNVAIEDGTFVSIELNNISRFNNNEISGATIGLGNPVIGCIELYDDCEMIGNVLTGDGANIWDIRTGETCEINGNTLSGENATFGEFDLMVADKMNNNELSGDGTGFYEFHCKGGCEVSGNVLSGNNTTIGSFEMIYSELKNWTLSTANKVVQFIYLKNAKLNNGTNIQVQQCDFTGIDIDLTGFTQDIIAETIENGKGWFTLNIDFSATTLVDGIPQLFNLIPVGGMITAIKAKGVISSGTSLTIGLEGDDPSLISQVVANYAAGQTYSGISAAATVNRSLRLASVGDINAGSVKIMVEFMV